MSTPSRSPALSRSVRVLMSLVGGGWFLAAAFARLLPREYDAGLAGEA